MTGDADGTLEERRERAQAEHEAERAAAGDDAKDDVAGEDVDALEGIDFASPEAKSRAAHFELPVEAFDDETPGSTRGFNLDDVDSIALALEEATAEAAGEPPPPDDK